MKKLKLIAAVFIAATALYSCKPTPEEARKYNDDLIAIEKSLSAKETALVEAIADKKSAEEIKKAHDELIKEADKAVADVEKTEVFDSSVAFLDAAKEYFKTVKELANNEYKGMVELLSKKSEEITEADHTKYEELVKSLGEKSDKVLEKIQTEQMIFATKYGFKVGDKKEEESK